MILLADFTSSLSYEEGYEQFIPKRLGRSEEILLGLFQIFTRDPITPEKNAPAPTGPTMDLLRAKQAIFFLRSTEENANLGSQRRVLVAFVACKQCWWPEFIILPILQSYQIYPASVSNFFSIDEMKIILFSNYIYKVLTNFRSLGFEIPILIGILVVRLRSSSQHYNRQRAQLQRLEDILYPEKSSHADNTSRNIQ